MTNVGLSCDCALTSQLNVATRYFKITLSYKKKSAGNIKLNAH